MEFGTRRVWWGIRTIGGYPGLDVDGQNKTEMSRGFLLEYLMSLLRCIPCMFALERGKSAGIILAVRSIVQGGGEGGDSLLL